MRLRATLESASKIYLSPRLAFLKDAYPPHKQWFLSPFGLLGVYPGQTRYLFALRPSQQFFSRVGMSLPGLNQYLKQRIKCVPQEHNAVPTVRLEPATLQSRVKHSTTEPLLLPLSDLLPVNGEFPS